MNKYWTILEFDKIIEELKKKVRLDYNKNFLDNVVLFEDIVNSIPARLNNAKGAVASNSSNPSKIIAKTFI